MQMKAHSAYPFGCLFYSGKHDRFNRLQWPLKWHGIKSTNTPSRHDLHFLWIILAQSRAHFPIFENVAPVFFNLIHMPHFIYPVLYKWTGTGCIWSCIHGSSSMRFCIHWRILGINFNRIVKWTHCAGTNRKITEQLTSVHIPFMINRGVYKELKEARRIKEEHLIII